MNQNGMSVFVTGGSGRLGRYLVKRLFDAGYTVKSFDRIKPENEIEGIDYIIGDITDFNYILERVKGCDFVVHLAALPDPSRGSTREIMRINVLGTFNVFQAAVKSGIKKLVQASSINYLGIAFGVKIFQPKYFPIDEEHPPLISDAYSLSKKIDEEIAEYFWNRDSFSSFSLRFPGLFNKEQLNPPKKNTYLDTIEELEKMSEGERETFIENIFRLAPESRTKNGKMPWSKIGIIFEARRNLFTYLEYSDAMDAIKKCLESDLSGTYPLFLNAPDTGYEWETNRLIKAFFPSVKEFKRPIIGNEPMVCNDKAQKLIGFSPKFSLVTWKNNEGKINI